MSIENPEKYKEFKTETLINTLNSHPFTVKNYKKFIKEKSDFLDTSFSIHHISHLLLARSKLNDSIVISAAEIFFKQNQESINVIAVGGYGRNELHPYSDTDLLLLIEKNEKKSFQDSLAKFLTFLWDIGIQVGHSTRTLQECLKEGSKDLTVATSLMEARYLYGSITTYQTLEKEITGNKLLWSNTQFLEGKKNEQLSRHSQFNNTAYNLEPNIKSGPGGLRDIHSIFWVGKKILGIQQLQELNGLGIISNQQLSMLIHARDFLFSIRYALHALTQRKEDRLLFDYQRTLAKQFDYHDEQHLLGVEQFMQDYYKSAKTISRLNEIILQTFAQKLFQSKKSKIITLNHSFQIRDNLVELRKGIQFKDNPSLLLEIFLLFQKHKDIQGIGSKTISMITENLHLIDDSFRENTENKKLFLDILKAPEGVTHELKRMNLYGVLGLYIPAFGKIEGRMQYDLFHAFTIDEHTLLVVSNLRRLALKRFDHEYMEYSKKMQLIATPEILYIAGLFHDIAKGRNEDHSILGSIEAESFCMDHGMSKYESKLVSWLVENHLILSLTAQRKDINDPNVIRSFAIKVGDESRLDFLYLLTICDVRATNPNLWSTWKRQLFDELYLLTKKALREGLENPIDKDELIAEKKNLVEAKLNGNQRKKGLTNLFSFLGESYFLKFKDQEIIHHSKIIMEKKFLENPKIIINLQQDIIEGQTCVFIICQTQSNAFLTATGIFEQTNLTIHDAKVTELNNGYSIYNFYVQEMNGVAIEDKKKIQQIKSRIEKTLSVEDDSSPIVSRALSRRLRYFDTKTSINFTEDHINNRTVMELISIDRPGLLFDIAKTLKTENIWIESAKIATIGERVEDIFYLTTQNKVKLSKSNCEQLEKKLEKVINQS